MITYDKGGLWWTLKLGGAKDDDEKTLHLALDSAQVTSGIPLPQSTETAHGIIIANGWYDDAIPTAGADATARSYISRDGGQHWSETAPTANNFRIMDHGGVILMAPWRRLTTEVKFSLDFGWSFNS